MCQSKKSIVDCVILYFRSTIKPVTMLFTIQSILLLDFFFYAFHVICKTNVEILFG